MKCKTIYNGCQKTFDWRKVFVTTTYAVISFNPPASFRNLIMTSGIILNQFDLICKWKRQAAPRPMEAIKKRLQISL